MQSPDKTGFNCAACDRPDNEESQMVFCDHCQRWYHFGCVGVTADVKDVSWCCQKCVGSASEGVVPADVQEGLKELKAEKAKQKREMEKEKILHRKRLEMKQELFEMRQQLEKEKREMELEFEQAQMAKKLAEEEAHQRKLDQMRTEMEEKLKQLKLKRNSGAADGEKELEQAVGGGKVESSKSGTKKKTESKQTKPGKGLEKKKSRNGKPGIADATVVDFDDPRGAYHKHSTPKVCRKLTPKPVGGPSSLSESFLIGRGGDSTPLGRPGVPKPEKVKTAKKMKKVMEVESESASSEEEEESAEEVESCEEEEEDSSSEEEESSAEEEESSEESSESSEEEKQEEKPRRKSGKEKDGRKNRQREPTKAQMSARQFLSRKLPTFSGRMEEWPMFISSYETSTKACGFSDVENLARLQECLKGEALEAVRSRLLLPKSVPKIVETLRMLYGRPERLLNVLLAKVRNAAPPKADRLASFISFGVVVQQLADHLEATGLTTHLVNPMLIQELTEKLPAGTQLEWVRYRRKTKVVTLRTLSNFLSSIVKDASEVAAYGEGTPRSGESGSKKGSRSRAHDGYVHSHDVEENRSSSPPRRERKPCRICGRVDHRIRNCEKLRRLQLGERWEAVRRWKLCQLCLNEHGNAGCKLSFRCNVEGCKERHNPLLHFVRPAAGLNCNVHAAQPKQTVIFRMMPVTLHCGKHSVNTIAFLDEGSSYTLVERALVNRLGVRGATQPLRVTWTAGVSRIEKDSQCVSLFISGRGSAQRFQIKSAHTVESLKLPQHTVAISEVVRQYAHLQGLPITDIQHAAPQILIGLKDIHLYAPLESRIGRPEEPIAVRSKLGWTVYGPTGPGNVTSGMVAHHSCSPVSNQELHDLLKNHYTLEESGISIALLPEPEEDRRAMEMLKKSTRSINDRFVAGLPGQNDDTEATNSYPIAVKKSTLKKRQRKDPEIDAKVNCVIADNLGEDYVYEATALERLALECSKVWHVPLNIDSNPCEEKSNCIQRLPVEECVRVPRYYSSSIQLHVFVDSGQDAPDVHGTVAYVRIETATGPLCSLVMARSKSLAPLQHMSIPRLELQAGVLGARLANSVRKTILLKVIQRSMWSDSKTVLSWIHSDHGRYEQIQEFRIGKVRIITRLAEWRLVPTKCNVADVLTKWEKVLFLRSDGPWFRGLRFRYQPEECWTKQEREDSNSTEEIRACLQFHEIPVTESIVDPLWYSKRNVAVQAVVCVYRLASNGRRKRDEVKIEVVPAAANVRSVVRKLLKRDEYREADAYIRRSVQTECSGHQQLSYQQQQSTKLPITVTIGCRSKKVAPTVLNDGWTLTDEVRTKLTYVGLEPKAEEALTPNRFVHGVGAISEERSFPPTSEAEALRDRYKRSQRLAEKLCTRWVSEYLPSFNQRTKWLSESPPLPCGNLKNITDDEVQKNWVRCIVTDVYPSTNGITRPDMVKGKFSRLVTRLAVLEVHEGKSGAAEEPHQSYGRGCVSTAAYHPSTAQPERSMRSTQDETTPVDGRTVRSAYL